MGRVPKVYTHLNTSRIEFVFCFVICSMTILYFIFILGAFGSDPGAGTSQRDRSRSRDVDNYLRSMSKIKPNWPEEKILRSARAIYGDDSVPLSVPQYQPGTAPERIAGATQHQVVTGMSTKEKKQEVYRIRGERPTFSTVDIADEFKRQFPLEPNPPTSEIIRRYLFFYHINGRLENMPAGRSWNHLSSRDKVRYNEIGMGIMRRRYLANPTTRWEELVFETISEIYQTHGFRFEPSSVYNWYLDVRKEVASQRSGTKRSRQD